MRIKVLFSILLILCSIQGYNQAIGTTLSDTPDIPDKYYSKVEKQLNSVNDQLTKKSLKYLAKFERQEIRLQQKLQKLNPELVIASAADKYNELSQKIKSKTGGLTKILSGEYVPNMDSLGNSLAFLKQVNGISDKASAPLSSFNLLQGHLQESQQIQAFIAERKQQIKEMLSKFSNLPGSIKNGFTQLNKTAYYYSAQVKEYKDMLKDPKKIEQQALNILDKIPAFQKFIRENGQLGNLFGIPANYSSNQALQGLQTLDQVQQLVRSRIGSGAGASQMLQQQVQAAEGELNKFKDKLNQLGGGSADIAMPDFVPQNQKTKPFLKRLEYGFNIQTTHSSYNFPTTSDIGGSVGYRWKNKITLGIGASYKIGWGSGFQHIQITSQGMSLRSFFDYKIKKSFSATGGFEYNYQQPFSSIVHLAKSDAWQQSGLIGITKTIEMKSKVFKKTNVQLLWDFLSYEQQVRTPALLFRVGYTF
jgi:hypothetical protein